MYGYTICLMRWGICWVVYHFMDISARFGLIAMAIRVRLGQGFSTQATRSVSLRVVIVLLVTY